MTNQQQGPQGQVPMMPQGQGPQGPMGPGQMQNPNMPPQQQGLEFSISPAMYSWLEEEDCSIAFTTYKNSRLFFLGRKDDGKLSIFERLFAHAMGLWTEEERIYLASQFQIWKFDNVTVPGEQYKGYDKLFVPRVGYTTGNLDTHDLIIDKNGRMVFVNTLFSCLCTLSEKHSFKPIWVPPFITKLKPEDRCHLNGLAMRDGMPKYVSAICRSDVHHGWRDRRDNGGILMDIDTNEVVAENLSMPHSPRWHDGKLWVLQSGTGQLGYIDDGKFQEVCFIPGYLRGLAFQGKYAIVGLSKCRQERSFSGLKLDENLGKKDADARCGIHIIDLETGDLHAFFELKTVVDELYDVQILRGVKRPQALGFKKDDVSRVITIEKQESDERDEVIVLPPRQNRQEQAAAARAAAQQRAMQQGQMPMQQGQPMQGQPMQGQPMQGPGGQQMPMPQYGQQGMPQQQLTPQQQQQMMQQRQMMMQQQQQMAQQQKAAGNQQSDISQDSFQKKN